MSSSVLAGLPTLNVSSPVPPLSVVRVPAAVAWKTYEMRCSSLVPSPDAEQAPSPRTLAMSRIECHYAINGAFLKPGELLAAAPRFRAVPGYIVHGRYDMLCPAESAVVLSRAWPEAKLTIVPDAGHAATEPGIRAALLAAMDDLGRV